MWYLKEKNYLTILKYYQIQPTPEKSRKNLCCEKKNNENTSQNNL